MSRIRIEDLPVLEDLSAKDIKGIFGCGLQADGTVGSQTWEIQQSRDSTAATEEIYGAYNFLLEISG